MQINNLPPETPAFEAVDITAHWSTVSVHRPKNTYSAGKLQPGNWHVFMQGGQARLLLSTENKEGMAAASLSKEGAAVLIAALRAVYPTLA